MKENWESLKDKFLAGLKQALQNNIPYARNTAFPAFIGATEKAINTIISKAISEAVSKREAEIDAVVKDSFWECPEHGIPEPKETACRECKEWAGAVETEEPITIRNMKEKINKIIIAKDGWPLELIIGRPVTNFFRRLFLGDHIECQDCWYRKSAQKTSDGQNLTSNHKEYDK